MASARLRSQELLLPAGETVTGLLNRPPERSFGFLVIDGLICVELEAGRAHSAWLMGADDLIRPWELGEISLTRGGRWHALKDTRLAVLGPAIYRQVQRQPGVIDRLLGLSARTAYWMMAKSLIVSAPNIEDRLLLLFAVWTERWGKVTPDGIWIDLPLTHELLGNCCGARRPTVTVGLSSLEEKGFILDRSRAGLLLSRDPPVNGSSPSWQRYGDALRDGREAA